MVRTSLCTLRQANHREAPKGLHVKDSRIVFVRATGTLISARPYSARAQPSLPTGVQFGWSQLAIEFAYRTRERSPETWVFWVYASNAARFEQSYRDIADCVKISGRRNPRANIFKLVYD